MLKSPQVIMGEILLVKRIGRLAHLKGKIGHELVEQNPDFKNTVPVNPEEDYKLTNMSLNEAQRLRLRRIDSVIQGRARQASINGLF